MLMDQSSHVDVDLWGVFVLWSSISDLKEVLYGTQVVDVLDHCLDTVSHIWSNKFYLCSVETSVIS